jgi:hypothetical protein
MMVKVEFSDDGVYVYEDVKTSEGFNRTEVVCWVQREWEEDPDIVPAICETVRLALLNPSRLRLLLERTAEHDEQVADYVDACDRICPACTAVMEPHDEPILEDDALWQQVYCPECRAYFVEIYRLVDLADIRGLEHEHVV